MNYTSFEQKIQIKGTIIFNTAFHIGSGKEGELATDMGVLKDEQDWPVLPGSSLKGCFRSTAEKIAGHIGRSACLLDASLSGEECVGDQQYFMDKNEEFKKIKNEREKIDWLEANTCDVCKLFGSPMQASRIFFSDGEILPWQGAYHVRDGVVIDRDSGTARPRLKFDFEVTSKDTQYEIFIELENPIQEDIALVAAVISEWQNGFRLGGFTSRGLGSAILTQVETKIVDYNDPDKLKDYLVHRKMEPAPELLSQALQSVLNQ